jgi:hypothetical protein
MPGRLQAAALLLGLALAGATAGASSSASVPPSSARALAVQVISAAGSGGSAGAVSAPPDAVAFGGFVYPDDGSVASVGSVTAKASAVSTKNGSSASASASAGAISLFGGEITADAVVGAAHASASPSGGSGDFSAASVSNLVALGQAVGTSPGTQVSLADWGSLTVNSQSVVPGSVQGAPSYQESMTALVVHLTADHGGLAAGSEIQIGYAQAAAQGTTPIPPPPPPTTTAASPPPPPPPTTTTGPSPPAPKPKPVEPKPSTPPAATPDRTAPKKKPALHAPEAPEAGSGPRLPVVHNAPLTVVPKLTGKRYVFPVYGPSSYTDTFGAPRADVSWHHGDDIFAPLGAPVLAIADGIVFSVGWNHLGGYRLWLRDEAGNQFYYAHLSAYSPLAINGRPVQAGSVLGFVGNTGDAVGTPYHLHFEIHPKSLLALGYDGAVDPTQYLDAWRHLQDVRLTPSGWAPPAARPKRGVKPAPPPGAILLQADDISTASGLDPGSMQRVLAPLEHEGDGFLVGAHQTPPSGPHPVRVH